MEFNFKTITEFNDYFKDEKTCYEFYEKQRWNGSPVCPHCASTKKPYNAKARGKFKDIPAYRCSEKGCLLPFTVRTGTIFEGSKVEFRKWLHAIYELSTAKKGISSVELAIRIGVSQKTGWFINHRLREMLKQTAPETLTGVSEIDETFVGGKESNKHESKKLKAGRGAVGKTPVFGVVNSGKVRTQVVTDVSGQTLLPLVYNNIEAGSIMVSDDHKAYSSLKNDYLHEVVKHSQGEYVTDLGFHTNSIEGFWGLLKRGIVGTFHYVSPQHLQRYCDEFSYKYNTRDSSNIYRFDDSLSKAEGKRIKYRQLTAGKPKAQA